jgi:DNA ligase (NAD+)
VRRCVNASCPAQVKERLTHFCSRDAMDCEGVGPALVDQLVEDGLVSNAADLYRLTKDDLQKREGIKEKSSQKIVSSIRGSLDRDFARVLFALGIRHVGWTTAAALAEAAGSMDKLQSTPADELSKIEGIGQVVAESVRDFFDNPENKRLIDGLRKAGLKMETGRRTGGPLEGRVFLFTGELKSMSRSEAEELVVSLGGKSGDSVTKATSHVVIGENPGSKLAKAKSMGKTIIDEKAFLEMTGKS